MAAATAAALIGSSTLQMGASFGQQAIQNNFTQSLVNQGVKSFTDAGLPSYMYYSGDNTKVPDSSYNLNGSNYQTVIHGFDRDPPEQKNNAQAVNKTVKPVGFVRGSENPPLGFVKSANGNMFSGQTDRQGLGVGRYSAVGPPTHMSTQTDQSIIENQEKVKPNLYDPSGKNWMMARITPSR